MNMVLLGNDFFLVDDFNFAFILFDFLVFLLISFLGFTLFLVSKVGYKKVIWPNSEGSGEENKRKDDVVINNKLSDMVEKSAEEKEAEDKARHERYLKRHLFLVAVCLCVVVVAYVFFDTKLTVI